MNKKSTIILYAFIVMTILAIGISGTCISKEFIKISQKFDNFHNIQNTQENNIPTIECFQIKYKKLLLNTFFVSSLSLRASTKYLNTLISNSKVIIGTIKVT